MITPSDFQYAMEESKLLHGPVIKVNSHGGVTYNFFVITEDEDRVDRVFVREGKLDAMPLKRGFSDEEIEGQAAWLRNFGPEAHDAMEFLLREGICRIQLCFDRLSMQTHSLSGPVDKVTVNVLADIEHRDNPADIVIYGVEKGWEVALLKFASLELQEAIEQGRV